MYTSRFALSIRSARELTHLANKKVFQIRVAYICLNFKKEELKGGWVSRPKFFGNILSAVCIFPFYSETWYNVRYKELCYIEVLFRIFYYCWGKENRSLYRGLLEVRYIEVPLCNETSPFQMSTAYLYINQSLLFCYFKEITNKRRLTCQCLWRKTTDHSK